LWTSHRRRPDRSGGEPVERPVHFAEVLATLYHCLGIDANATTVRDLAGRPQYVVDKFRPMARIGLEVHPR
jgi:hypothetical protein